MDGFASGSAAAASSCRGRSAAEWASADFNAPDEAACAALLDRAVLGGGVNLVDTAEQYPIPSGPNNREGLGEELIGRWCKGGPGRREKLVVASKITGGPRSVSSAKRIVAQCEGSLRRLGTDYLDVYQLHWPARYSPQANWGQSLAYDFEAEPYYASAASFEQICLGMGELIAAGKLRGWGLCNDNAFGLTACCEVAKRLGVRRPSRSRALLARQPALRGGGVFGPRAPCTKRRLPRVQRARGRRAHGQVRGRTRVGRRSDKERAARRRQAPRGRMDEPGWGSTLYRYRTSAALEAAREYANLAKRFGLKSPTELALRWCKQRRGLTSVLLGTSNLAQLDEDLGYFREKAPLPSELMWEIDRVHMRNRLPIFSSDRVGKDWNNEGEIGERIP